MQVIEDAIDTSNAHLLGTQMAYQASTLVVSLIQGAVADHIDNQLDVLTHDECGHARSHTDRGRADSGRCTCCCSSHSLLLMEVLVDT